MAESTIAMLVSLDTTTKGGGPHVPFFKLCPPLRDMFGNVRDKWMNLFSSKLFSAVVLDCIDNLTTQFR